MMYKNLKISVLFLFIGIFSTDAQTENWQSEMLNEVNALRAKGCKCGRKYYPPAPALTWNTQLELAANNHAIDMSVNRYFSHTSKNGKSYAQRIEDAGYHWRSCAENIAKGQSNGKQAFLDWRKSPSHCVNMMSKETAEMGAANDGDVWVQDFGSLLLKKRKK